MKELIHKRTYFSVSLDSRKEDPPKNEASCKPFLFENEFDEDEFLDVTHFHNNGFARRFVLTL